ncbi:anhydro-N-acetylmuramic acid kinase [Kaistella palustris]|uniref:anhydro-N-acetylmuramic acid kinase n=1 Tax=Kaistella palustris TaxID=493376 RepID=UPI00040B0C0F|nr:anhydro-N-acetylmuramic acid kinase [Kaistella palustris]
MEFQAIGLMSGTSLDGLDICFARFKKDRSWTFEILCAETIPYSQHWDIKLRNAVFLKAEELLALNSEYGFYLGNKVKEFIGRNALGNVDLIASHGHTVFHQPQKKFTLQIGDGRAIHIINEIPVIYDFRSADVLRGGNGAPLVPIGDELLFSEFDACLNLGGFSNISFKENGRRIAFDICPVNIVLNDFAKKLGHDFDENGALAKSGMVNENILAELNTLSFYGENPPKSLGIEWVNANVFPLLKEDTPQNILATFTEHAAEQIAETFNKNKIRKVLFTGGGTYNSWLLERIKSKTNAETVIPDARIIDFKEALIFAFMGVLRFNNEINILSSATGSTADHCAGILI